MPTSLGTINSKKDLQNTFQPLLLAVFTFKDSITSPTILRVSSHNLTAGSGTQPTGITGFPHNNQDFTARINNPEIAATQAMSDMGIDITPTVSIEFADGDKNIFTTFERPIGFKGATLELFYVFNDVGTNNYSSNFKQVFKGTCGPGNMTETGLTVQAISKMNMNQIFLPTIRVQKRCPWVYPDITNMTLTDAAALHTLAAEDQSVDQWHCGYSYLSSSAQKCGNPIPGTTTAFPSCDFTFDSCLDRLGNRSAVLTPQPGGGVLGTAPIEKDQAGRQTARFGGVRWDQPSQFKSRGYGQAKSDTGFNSLNEAKYNDYIPMGWGTYWIDPVVMNIVGDFNFTRMEVVVGTGVIGNIRHVICNDIDVDQLSGDSSTANAQYALQLFWAPQNSGDRIGNTNKTSIYAGQGDPYGSFKSLIVNVPRQLTPSSSVPRIRVLLDGPTVRVYSDPVTFTETFSSCPAWILMDMLVWSGWKYEDIDIQTFIDAAAYYDTSIPYNNVSGYVNVLNDGITVQQIGGNDFSTLFVGQTIFIQGVAKVIATIDSYTQLTITVAFPHLGSGHPNAISNTSYLGSGANNHARFRLGLGISQRISAADLIRQVRTSCRSTIVPSSEGGLFQLFPDKTLADQQPAPVDGSNFNTQLTSIKADGTAGTGYVAYRFNYSSVIPDGSGNSTLNISQLDIKDSPNRVSFPFYDEDNTWAQDSLTVVDSNDVQLVGNPVDGTIPCIGIPNFDQCKRITSTWIAKNNSGNSRGNTGGTFFIKFTTSFKCIHLRMGHIVLLDYPQYNIQGGVTDSTSGAVSGFLARVTSIKPSPNFQTADITLQYHMDQWYVDSFEQNGFQHQNTQFRNALARPPFPLMPWTTQPLAGDPLFSVNNWQFGVQQLYDKGQSLASIQINTKLPINSFAPNSLTPPTVGAQGTTGASGGTIRAGIRYYGQVCGRDAAGNLTVGSDPSAPCIIDVPAGSNTATLSVPVTRWPDGTAGYELFVGRNRSRMSNQKSGTVTLPGTPTSISITDFNEMTWGIPDIEFNSLAIKGKRCQHAGVIGNGLLSVTSTTIQLSLLTNDQLTNSQFAPDISGNKYYIFLVALWNSTSPVPIADWSVVDNTGDTFTVTGPDPTTIDRGDGTFGLMANDVVIISMRPTVGVDGGGNYIEDPNWVNALNPLGVAIPITNITVATPMAVTTATPHGLATHDKVFIDGVVGTTEANGVWFANVTGPNDFELFSDSALTTPGVGVNAYISDGTAQLQDQGLAVNGDVGNELFIAHGTGKGTWYKIKSNTKIRIYIEGDWIVAPDATSVAFINNPNWEFENDTAELTNSRKDIVSSFTLDVPNFLNEIVFIQAFTRDAGNNEAFRPVSPFRLIYMFGVNSTVGGVSLADPGYVTITPDGSNDYHIDLSLGLNQRILLTSATATTILAPIWTGGTIVSGVSFTLYIDQDSTGNWPCPIFALGTGSWTIDVQNQGIDGTPSTRTIYIFTFHGVRFGLDSFRTGAII